MHRLQCGEMWGNERICYKSAKHRHARLTRLTPVYTGAQVLLFGTQHSSLIFFEFSSTKFLLSDWSTRFSLTNLIG